MMPMVKSLSKKGTENHRVRGSIPYQDTKAPADCRPKQQAVFFGNRNSLKCTNLESNSI